MFGKKKEPLEQEWQELLVLEERYKKRVAHKQETVLTQKLEDKIPVKLQDTLEKAFVKAFEMVFEKGTGIIEKTYNKEKLEQEYLIQEYTADIKQNKKSLRKFHKGARASGTKNLLLSGASGIGLGVLGVGIPDIPLFTGMVLKGIYEIALNYGYSYESAEERYYVLTIIQAALSYGEEHQDIDSKIESYMEDVRLPKDYDSSMQIHKTAATMSKELLYMKFLQGIPIVGAVGGAFDAICMKRITEYARIKYRKRFLLDRRAKGILSEDRR